MCQNQPTSEGGSSMSTLMSGFIHSCVNRQSMFNIYISIYIDIDIYICQTQPSWIANQERGGHAGPKVHQHLFFWLYFTLNFWPIRTILGSQSWYTTMSPLTCIVLLR